MNHAQEIFLNAFDAGFRTHIVEYAKRLTKVSSSHDVMICMARKAICLVDSLIELRMIQPSCVVTSSRILDMDLGWLKGKRVALVDDALVCGTTLASAVGLLTKSGVGEVSVHVLCVNREYWVRDLVQPVPPFVELNDSETSLICSQIVKAISLVPRPYNIDYPIYSKMRVPRKRLSDVGLPGHWLLCETTKERQGRDGIRNFTAIPSEGLLWRLFGDELGFDIPRESIFKIRLYVAERGDICWIKALPVVVLPPLRVADLDKMFVRLVGDRAESLGPWFRTRAQDKERSSVLRLVQYYLGCKLIKKWIDDLSDAYGEGLIPSHDLNNLGYLFPAPVVEEVLAICASGVSFGDLDVRFVEQSCADLGQTDDGFDAPTGIAKLTAPFLEAYRKIELPAREEARCLASCRGELPKRHHLDRLKVGKTLRDLVLCLQGISSSVDPMALVSWFLDAFVDEGVVVPVVVSEDGIVYRAYRHGEDVEFAENERRLCAAMLARFSESYGSDEIPRTVVEKLLVAFVRVGLSKGVLNYAKDYLSQYEKVGIRFHLHGAIVGSFGEKLHSYNPRDTLSCQLISLGYLYPVGRTGRLRPVGPPETGMDEDGRSLANRLGDVLGAALNREAPLLRMDDLILIATCPSPYDVLGALSAELKIHNAEFGRAHFGELKHASAKRRDWGAFRKSNQVVSLNSGTWKYRNYRTGRPQKVIKETVGKFPIPLYGSEWEHLWSGSRIDGGEDSDINIRRLIEEAARILYLLRFYYDVVEASTSDVDLFSDFQRREEMAKIIDECATFGVGANELETVFCDIEKKWTDGSIKKDALFAFALQKINSLVYLGADLLASIDAGTMGYGKVENVRYYEHVLSLTVKGSGIPVDQIEEVFGSVVQATHIQARKAQKGNSTYLQVVPSRSAPVGTKLWAAASGDNARYWLVRLCANLVDRLGRSTCMTLRLYLHMDARRISLFKNPVTNEFYGECFWAVSRELRKAVPRAADVSEVICHVLRDDTKKVIAKNLKECFPHARVDQKKDLRISSPVYVAHDTVTATLDYLREDWDEMDNCADVGVLTVKAEEYAAVTRTLNADMGNVMMRKRRKYCPARLENVDGEGLDVVISQALQQGDRSLIKAYDEMVAEFRPKIVVLLGIAGAASDKVDIGDVVVARQVVGYDTRVEGAEGIAHRPDLYHASAYVSALFQRFSQEYGGDEPKIAAGGQGEEAEEFKVYYGDVASGAAVVKSVEAPTRQWLAEVSDKVYVVETEATGAFQCFEESGLDPDTAAKHLFVIRGISDKADVDKNDEHQKMAAEHAAIVLKELVARVENGELG